MYVKLLQVLILSGLYNCINWNTLCRANVCLLDEMGALESMNGWEICQVKQFRGKSMWRVLYSDVHIMVLQVL